MRNSNDENASTVEKLMTSTVVEFSLEFLPS